MAFLEGQIMERYNDNRIVMKKILLFIILSLLLYKLLILSMFDFVLIEKKIDKMALYDRNPMKLKKQLIY